LPWLHSVTVVTLKFVVVVVIAFAHGEKGEEERVARAATSWPLLPFGATSACD
jgi:hypothetical protein